MEVELSPGQSPFGDRRVYPPGEVQARLAVSASGLQRLAGIYERTVGPLPCDERGRLWPEEVVDALEAAKEQRAVSIEATLRGQDLLESAPKAASGTQIPHQSPGGSLQDRIDVGAAILEELRVLVEEQNRRIAKLEETVRTGDPVNRPPRGACPKVLQLRYRDGLGGPGGAERARRGRGWGAVATPPRMVVGLAWTSVRLTGGLRARQGQPRA
jgi:hypothetical protein